METVGPRLDSHRFVGVDTSIFIYMFEDSPQYGDLAELVMTQIASGVVRGVTSSVTLMEAVVLPLRMGNSEMADSYESSISRLNNLQIVNIESVVARRAAYLRARYGTHPADALQIGACLHAGATAFVTNNKRLGAIRELEVIVLDDFIH